MSLPVTSPAKMAHADPTPSPWVVRWSHLIAPGAEVLDLACGHGRHMRYLAEKGFSPVGVDRDPAALAQAQAWGETLLADVENHAWPWPGRLFGAVVITNYLWRPLWPQILASLAPQGVLICETFALGQETVGRPSRADFLLRHGELLQCGENLHIVAYENGFQPQPEKFVQRIAAVRPDMTLPKPVRYPLSLE